MTCRRVGQSGQNDSPTSRQGLTCRPVRVFVGEGALQLINKALRCLESRGCIDSHDFLEGRKRREIEEDTEIVVSGAVVVTATLNVERCKSEFCTNVRTTEHTNQMSRMNISTNVTTICTSVTTVQSTRINICTTRINMKVKHCEQY